MKNSSFYFLVLVLLGSIGCTKKEVVVTPIEPNPEEAVRSFVQLSGKAKELGDRSKLIEMCSGDMKKAFQEMNEEQFRLFYLNGNVNVLDLKILSTSKNEESAKVQYQVLVENKQGTDITKETNEREAELVKSGNSWLIEAIRPKGIDKLIFTKGMVF